MLLELNLPTTVYRWIIESLENETSNTASGVIVAGDIITRAVDCGMPRTSTRGRHILEMGARTDFHILNVGNVYTLG